MFRVALMALALASCAAEPAQPSSMYSEAGEVLRPGNNCPSDEPPATRDLALACADAAFRTANPRVPEGVSRRIYDDGDQWIVSYRPPEGWAGGGGIITVSKHYPVVHGTMLGQ